MIRRSSVEKQRIKLTQINPNPFFEKWLLDWIQQAENNNSMKKHSLTKALASLRKYPLMLRTGRDCAILDGFGAGICRMLDQKLKTEKNLVSEQKLNESLKQAVNKAVVRINQVSGRSSHLLLKLNVNTKNVIQEKRHQLKKSVLKPTAVLNQHEEDVHAGQSSFSTQQQNTDTVFMTGGSFTIILLVDTQETAGKTKRNLDATIQQLTEKNIKFEVRRLSVGDFLWICRDKENREVILPYIVERKRMDDLAGSIKDGRFKEQKFRLKDCGIQNVIYMIESKGSNQFLGLPISTLLQNATNTQVQNDFSVKYTDSHADSMLCLSVLTNILIKTYKVRERSVFQLICKISE